MNLVFILLGCVVFLFVVVVIAIWWNKRQSKSVITEFPQQQLIRSNEPVGDVTLSGSLNERFKSKSIDHPKQTISKLIRQKVRQTLSDQELLVLNDKLYNIFVLYNTSKILKEICDEKKLHYGHLNECQVFQLVMNDLTTQQQSIYNKQLGLDKDSEHFFNGLGYDIQNQPKSSSVRLHLLLNEMKYNEKHMDQKSFFTELAELYQEYLSVITLFLGKDYEHLSSLQKLTIRKIDATGTGSSLTSFHDMVNNLCNIWVQYTQLRFFRSCVNVFKYPFEAIDLIKEIKHQLMDAFIVAYYELIPEEKGFPIFGNVDKGIMNIIKKYDSNITEDHKQVVKEAIRIITLDSQQTTRNYDSDLREYNSFLDYITKYGMTLELVEKFKNLETLSKEEYDTRNQTRDFSNQFDEVDEPIRSNEPNKTNEPIKTNEFPEKEGLSKKAYDHFFHSANAIPNNLKQLYNYFTKKEVSDSDVMKDIKKTPVDKQQVKSYYEWMTGREWTPEDSEKWIDIGVFTIATVVEMINYNTMKEMYTSNGKTNFEFQRDWMFNQWQNDYLYF